MPEHRHRPGRTSLRIFSRAVVSHAFIRERTTQPGSPLAAEDVGSFIARILGAGGDTFDGQSIELRSPSHLTELHT